MTAIVCGKYGKMTALKRHELPNRAFGLPSKRSYPMPDPSHAKNAKARATQEYDRGGLTKREHNQIHKKADQVIASCKRGAANGLSGARQHWGPAKVKEFRAQVARCVRRKKCSSKRGKKEMYCTRGCKSAASRQVNR